MIKHVSPRTRLRTKSRDALTAASRVKQLGQPCAAGASVSTGGRVDHAGKRRRSAHTVSRASRATGPAQNRAPRPGRQRPAGPAASARPADFRGAPTRVRLPVTPVSVRQDRAAAVPARAGPGRSNGPACLGVAARARRLGAHVRPGPRTARKPSTLTPALAPTIRASHVMPHTVATSRSLHERYPRPPHGSLRMPATIMPLTVATLTSRPPVRHSYAPTHQSHDP